MAAYYNDNDKFAAAWLRELIKKNLIAPGEVDERSIKDVDAKDLKGFIQAHFFAGIGGWSYALRLAGWPDDREVWTGSCPCQPFSAAGQQRGTADERHLWPDFANLIEKRKPATVFGEQVGSPLGRQWLSGVRSDLGRMGYAVGASDLPASCVGAPHIRQRLFWVGFADRAGLQPRLAPSAPSAPMGYGDSAIATSNQCGDVDASDRWGDARCAGSQGRSVGGDGADEQPSGASGVGSMANADGGVGQQGREIAPRSNHGSDANEWSGFGGRSSAFILEHPESEQARLSRRPWLTREPVACIDGKTRSTKPGVHPLANGVSGRMVKLRGLGNAIVPQVAAEFIIASTEAIADLEAANV